MKSYLKITVMTFTIWMLTSLINSLLCGTYLSVANYYSGHVTLGILAAFFISLFFSAPGFFIFWMILMIQFGNGIYERALFRAALVTGFILAVITAIISWEIFKADFSINKYLFILFALLSVTTGIMLHFNFFKKINT